jgi:hypothetical protein
MNQIPHNNSTPPEGVILPRVPVDQIDVVQQAIAAIDSQDANESPEYFLLKQQQLAIQLQLEKERAAKKQQDQIQRGSQIAQADPDFGK